MSKLKVTRAGFMFYQVYDREKLTRVKKFRSFLTTRNLFVYIYMGSMENGKEKRPKGLIMKVLERCRLTANHRKANEKRQYLPPEGCFSVYVGPRRERFAVRTECVNHPLFQRLLDEAVVEYGYSTPGPLELPCDIEIFRKVLSEMEQEAMEMQPRCSFTRAQSGYRLLNPARSAVIG